MPNACFGNQVSRRIGISTTPGAVDTSGSGSKADMQTITCTGGSISQNGQSIHLRSYVESEGDSADGVLLGWRFDGLGYDPSISVFNFDNIAYNGGATEPGNPFSLPSATSRFLLDLTFVRVDASSGQLFYIWYQDWHGQPSPITAISPLFQSAEIPGVDWTKDLVFRLQGAASRADAFQGIQLATMELVG